MSSQSAAPHFLDQPRAVWATAFACVVGFMSIGLVDPILTSIAAGLDASPSQVSLLFTSYFFVTSVMMLATGFVSSRLGGRATLLLGAALIVVFAGLAGTSDSVAALVLYRGGWGLGNAFFVVTALSVIVASSRGGTASAILLYEAALGLGISAGPLVGAALGSMSWRYPFFGTATLMAIGFVAIALFLPKLPKPERKIGLSAPVRALGHPGLLTVALSAMAYNYAFFTVLAFVPFVLEMSAYATGLIFFGWGLLVAIFSVLVAPRLQARFSAPALMTGCLVTFALLLLMMGLAPRWAVAAGVVLSGAISGVCNTVFTEMALEVSDAPRPIASAGYNFLRWFAGVVAPYGAPLIAEHWGVETTFIVAAAAAVASPLVLFLRRSSLGAFAARPGETKSTLGSSPAPVMAAVDGSPTDEAVLARAVSLARTKGSGVVVAHVRMAEVFGDEAAELEDETAPRAIVESGLARVRASGLTAIPLLLRSSAALAAEAVLEQARQDGVSTLVVGEPHSHDLGDFVHGSFAATLAKAAPDALSVILVPEIAPKGEANGNDIAPSLVPAASQR
ncbi:MFS transporter [Consotaella salsifontis]|uniref:Predicted arabinose efflux permease, MFS family n=1 Tax=Consotaella salsifontis TaxID=1365950 RepID=A0A1T4MB61_9HYPH|nr:MFS transporter [Consotaella salsifontis]SJZ64111.1 Predicted arabinose efflux permease, MFS family [Consotaella salsifontis]